MGQSGKFAIFTYMKLKRKSLLFFSIGVACTSAMFLAFSFRLPSGSGVDIKDGKPMYKYYPVELPKSLSFAGEKVPLERQDIREQLDHQLLVNYYTHSGTIYILKLTTRYFPLISDRLKANGIPDDFKYLCVAESALQNQISRAGAVGFWQFMKDTGPRYGLQIDDEVDERYSVIKSTDAACKYFKEAYAKFGSWTAAAASYNCGQGGFNTQATYQRTSSYYDLMLPEETMNYIFRILALKYLIQNAEPFGYILEASDQYRPYKTSTVTISNTIPDLAQYAIDNNMTYKTLKLLNPWLRGHTLTIKGGKTYEIQLPADGFNK